jgi:hypothetical protein
MKEIMIRLTDKEYDEYVKKGQSEYVKKGQSEYRVRVKKDIVDEAYVKWMFMLGEYYRCLRD